MYHSKEIHEYLVKHIGKDYYLYPKCVKWYLRILKYHSYNKRKIDIRV